MNKFLVLALTATMVAMAIAAPLQGDGEESASMSPFDRIRLTAEQFKNAMQAAWNHEVDPSDPHFQNNYFNGGWHYHNHGKRSIDGQNQEPTITFTADEFQVAMQSAFNHEVDPSDSHFQDNYFNGGSHYHNHGKRSVDPSEPLNQMSASDFFKGAAANDKGANYYNNGQHHHG